MLFVKSFVFLGVPSLVHQKSIDKQRTDHHRSRSEYKTAPIVAVKERSSDEVDESPKEYCQSEQHHSRDLPLFHCAQRFAKARNPAISHPAKKMPPKNVTNDF